MITFLIKRNSLTFSVHDTSLAFYPYWLWNPSDCLWTFFNSENFVIPQKVKYYNMKTSIKTYFVRGGERAAFKRFHWSFLNNKRLTFWHFRRGSYKKWRLVEWQSAQNKRVSKEQNQCFWKYTSCFCYICELNIE